MTRYRVRYAAAIPACIVVGAVLFAHSAHAASGRSGAKAWDDPERAQAEDPDFSLQGEYKNAQGGLQVVGLGRGQFYAVELAGGLPGAGWDGNSVKPSRLGTDELKALISRGEYRPERRSSPTMGAPPPEGAVHLFDEHRASETLKNWQGGKLTPDGLLKEGCRTAQKYGSFKLHLEFRMPYKPTVQPSDQDRGNSGVYTFNRYETQLLDSFGLHFYRIERDSKRSSAWKQEFQKHLGFKPRSDRTQFCGSFYKFKTPILNMCLPPLTWQTYEITFTAPVFHGGKKTKNARITVVHNGVKIQDDVELPKGTGQGGTRREVPSERIYLQDHQNPVRFRNIWLVELGT
jgi:hypothetical protein